MEQPEKLAARVSGVSAPPRHYLSFDHDAGGAEWTTSQTARCAHQPVATEPRGADHEPSAVGVRVIFERVVFTTRGGGAKSQHLLNPTAIAHGVQAIVIIYI